MLADALGNIAPQDSDIAMLSYLQSHPATAERMAALSQGGDGEGGRLVSPADWALLQRYCADAAGKAE